MAVIAALLSAFLFALAAALQHREALGIPGTGVADIRLLARLGRRPWWWVGVGCDVASMALHVLALSLATLAVVQPLGVMGIVFALPLGALLRRQPTRRRDIVAVVGVTVGLAGLLRALPSRPDTNLPSLAGVLGCTVVVLALMASAIGFAHVHPGRPRPILLAVGAGTAFGLTAALVRTLILLVRQTGTGSTVIVVSICVAALGLTGYLLLQNAYRSGRFAASLATSTVLNPVVAVLAGGIALHDSLPTTAGQLVVIAGAAVLICAGIGLLVGSPAALSLAPTQPFPGQDHRWTSEDAPRVASASSDPDLPDRAATVVR